MMLKSSSLFAIALSRPSVSLILALVALGSVIPPGRASSFDDYKVNCMQRVRQQGLTQAVALDVCNCTIKKFKSLYSLQQFQDVVKKSKSDKAVANRLRDVGEACFESVLYEN
jgi:hypothetical protein